MSEWPLVLFTLAIQCAAGLVLATTLLDRVSDVNGASLRPLGIVIFPLAAVGLSASVFHLGRPLVAWKSLLNLGQSRLSLEVLITLLFVGAALLYSHAWWAQRTEYRTTIGVVTSFLAIAAIASSASVYMIPTQPAWDSGWIPLSFLGTMLVAGGAIAAASLPYKEAGAWRGYLLVYASAGGAMLLAAGIWMYAALSRGLPDQVAAARLREAHTLITSQYFGWYVLHLVLAGVVPILSWILVMLLRSTAPWLPVLCAVAVLGGSIIGRALMYVLGTKPPMF